MHISASSQRTVEDLSNFTVWGIPGPKKPCPEALHLQAREDLRPAGLRVVDRRAEAELEEVPRGHEPVAAVVPRPADQDDLGFF